VSAEVRLVDPTAVVISGGDKPTSVQLLWQCLAPACGPRGDERDLIGL